MLSKPVELLTRIFETCDGFPQVVALASVCKHTHAALGDGFGDNHLERG